MIPSPSGIVWCSRWNAIGEGPYTLAAKMLNANNLKTRYFRGVICWKRTIGASLLDPRPIESESEPAATLGRMLHQASLAARISHLYKELADDRELRYCPKCMSMGFQAAIAQIQGIDHCPIHGEAHRNACMRCGSKTPPYFLEDNTWLPGFSCRVCGAPFGGEVLIDRRLDAWKSPEQIYRLNPVHRWLERIHSSKELHWVNVTEWSATRLSPEGADEYRRYAVFGVLSSRFLPEKDVPESNFDQKLDVFGPYALGSNMDSQDLTQEEYDGILRRLILPTDLQQYRKHFRTPSFGVAVPTNPVVPPHLHAHLIWRAQFEKVSSIYSQFYSRSDFCHTAIPRLLNTAQDRLEVPLSNRALSEGVLTAAWTAALKIATEWHRTLVSFRQLTFAQADRQWLVSVDRWANRLGCWRDRNYFPIAVIKVRDTATEEHQLYFVVA